MIDCTVTKGKGGGGIGSLMPGQCQVIVALAGHSNQYSVNSQAEIRPY
jgi:hypothetical protein